MRCRKITTLFWGQQGADLNKIKKAYRVIAKKYHPDASASGESHEKFLEIREAYETLVTKEKGVNTMKSLPGRVES